MSCDSYVPPMAERLTGGETAGVQGKHIQGRKSAVEKVTPRRTPKSLFSTLVTVLLLSRFGADFFNDTEQ